MNNDPVELGVIKSTILEAIEPIIGFDIESLTDSEIDNLSKKELSYIRIAIDDALRFDSYKVGNSKIDTIIPIDYGEWSIGDLVHYRSRIPLSLLYRQVLLPLGSISSDVFEAHGYNYGGHIVTGIISKKRTRTKLVLSALRNNASLIKSGAVLPFSTDCYTTRSLYDLSFETTRKIRVDKLDIRPDDIAPVVSGIVGQERSDIIQSHFESLYRKLFLIRRWHASPAMIDTLVWNLWQKVANECLLPSIRRTDCEVSSTLTMLDLPGLGSLRPDEIVSLHKNSLAFAEWRTRLSSVLNRIKTRVESGDSIEQSLKEEILPLHDAVQLIEKDLKGSSLRELVIKNNTAVGIGAVAASTSLPLAHYLGADPSIIKDMLKIGSTAVVSILWPLLFSKPDEKKQCIANMYNKVFLSH